LEVWLGSWLTAFEAVVQFLAKAEKYFQMSGWGLLGLNKMKSERVVAIGSLCPPIDEAEHREPMANIVLIYDYDHFFL